MWGLNNRPSTLTNFNLSSSPVPLMLPVPQAYTPDYKDKSTQQHSAGQWSFFVPATRSFCATSCFSIQSPLA